MIFTEEMLQSMKKLIDKEKNIKFIALGTGVLETEIKSEARSLGIVIKDK